MDSHQANHTNHQQSQLIELKKFLCSAPNQWVQDQMVRQYELPNGETISCVLWHNIYHISGTDICKVMVHRFALFGREIKNMKKFEEGIFSDLRNLKPGVDATLENPRSPFLDFLFKHQSVRTQKKQKVFYWFSVPHDRLFLDALERDLKREALGLESATFALNPLPLLPTLELAKSQCEITMEGVFKTDSFQNLPTHLNYGSAWMKENNHHHRQQQQHPQLKEIQQQENSLHNFTSFLLPNAEPFLTNDESPSFSELATPSPSSSSAMSPLLSLPNGSDFSLFHQEKNSMSQANKVHYSRAQFNSSPLMQTTAKNNGSPKKNSQDVGSLHCNYPGCSRKFQRMEHLRRHKRTHTTSENAAKKLNARNNAMMTKSPVVHDVLNASSSLPGSPFLPALLQQQSPLLSGLESIGASPFLQQNSPFISPLLDLNLLSIHSPLMNTQMNSTHESALDTQALADLTNNQEMEQDSLNKNNGLMISMFEDPQTIDVNSFMNDLDATNFSISEALEVAAPGFPSTTTNSDHQMNHIPENNVGGQVSDNDNILNTLLNDDLSSLNEILLMNI